jgi:hypothetical protein
MVSVKPEVARGWFAPRQLNRSTLLEKDFKGSINN